jgi:hypothetical protein
VPPLARRPLDPTAHVYSGARAHVARWPPGHWHAAIAAPTSSQALCVSVWGTIASHPQRATILQGIFTAAGLDLGDLSSPTITCEDGADGTLAHLLNETGGNATPTCVDALVDWSAGAVCIESKFTEPSFGACGQTSVRTDRPPAAPAGTKILLRPACDGTHGTGSDFKTKTRAPCRLSTWDGSRAPRLYWDLAWEPFRADVLTPDGRLCPFSGPSFQLMRNLALARAKAAPRSTRPARDQAPVVNHRQWGLLVVHVRAHPNAVRHRAEFDAFRALLLDDVKPRVALIAYEDLLPILSPQGLDPLAAHVRARIEA